MSIRLRAHHLLCLTTYVGRGYTPAFTANYDRIIARLAAGEPIILVDGPDDICAPLLSDPDPHCHRDSVIERDRLARDSLSSRLQTDNAGQLTLRGEALAELRTAFRGGTIRAACMGCEWADLCDSVAGSGFAEVRLT